MNLRVAVMMNLNVIQIPNREKPRSPTPGLSSQLAPLAHSYLADIHDPSSLGKDGFQLVLPTYYYRHYYRPAIPYPKHRSWHRCVTWLTKNFYTGVPPA